MLLANTEYRNTGLPDWQFLCQMFKNANFSPVQWNKNVGTFAISWRLLIIISIQYVLNFSLKYHKYFSSKQLFKRKF